MSDELNWRIIPSDNSMTAVIPSTSLHGYDLFNEFVFQRLIYREREYGINLVWDDPDPSTPSIRFLPLRGGSTPIDYGERVAIHVRGGGYLKYAERDYGINLKWSDSPIYEWRLRGEGSQPNTPVDLTQSVGLFNIVRADYLFYDPRRYGINLKWVSDKGKHNSTPWYEDVFNAVSGFVAGLVTLFLEFGNRLFGVVDFVLTFFGIMLPKRVRIRIVILRGPEGKPVVSNAAQINKAIEVIRKCCSEQLNTSVRAAKGLMIETLPFPAPHSALYPVCGGGALLDELQSAGTYYREHMVGNLFTNFLGYGAPITIFLVDDIAGKLGCSLGPLTNYVLVDNAGMQDSPNAPEPRPTTAMHEIAHACGLWHRIQFAHTGNLMRAGTPRNIILELYQRALMRNSRHITFL